MKQPPKDMAAEAWHRDPYETGKWHTAGLPLHPLLVFSQEAKKIITYQQSLPSHPHSPRYTVVKTYHVELSFMFPKTKNKIQTSLGARRYTGGE